MSLAAAASHSLVGVATGIVVGALISLAVPGIQSNEAPQQLLLITATQAIVNGVAIAAASQLLDGSNDPTHGMLFTWALIMTQPEMSKRITMLAGDLGDAARRRVQTSAPASATAASG
jgi:hypothetical protein